MTHTVQSIHETRFPVRFYETDGQGYAEPTAVLTMLEDAAANHCESIGWGLFRLARQSIGWVLLSGRMEMDRYPRYGETVTVRTWLSGYSPARGYRENILLDGHGKILGRARSAWALYNVERRRPERISREILDSWGIGGGPAADWDCAAPIPDPGSGSREKRYRVNGFDTDSNRHVNNIRYLQWALDALDSSETEGKCLRSIDGRFVGEARLGDKIISAVENTGDQRYVHGIRSSQSESGTPSTVCARAISRWVPIESD